MLGRAGAIGLLATLSLCLPVLSNAQCSNINFTSTYTQKCFPVLVKFTAVNIPEGSIIHWNTGKGIVQGAATQYEIYEQDGMYDVTLQVSLPDGSVCTRKQSNPIKVSDISEAKFSFSQSYLCSLPASVRVTDSSTGVYIRSWWIDNVLISDTSRVISPVFTTSGLHIVRLYIESPSGCRKTFVRGIYVNDTVKADFCAVLKEDEAHQTITAYLTAKVDTVVKPLSYTWKNGTGTVTVSGKDAVMVFPSSAWPADILLNVVTQEGCTLSRVKNSLIQKYYSTGSSNSCLSCRLPSTGTDTATDATQGCHFFPISR